VNTVDFLSGLGLGLGFWYWSSRRWQHQLNQLVKRFPAEHSSMQIPLQVRLTKAVQSQQETAHSLQQRLSTWQAVLQAAPIGYLEVDEDACVYWHNAKAAELLNIELRRHGLLMRRSLLQVVRSYELDRLIESVRNSQSALCQDWTFHAVQNLQSAKDFPIRGYGFPLEDGHVGVFLEDRLEAAALAAERDRWTSDVAHELKTPLTSIRLVAEMLQTEVSATQRPWIDRLIQETIRLSTLVQDILELSHMTVQNTQVLQLSKLDLPRLIQQAWMTLEPLAQHKNLSLYYDGPESHAVQADPNRLLRVFMNLIDNGIKFSDRGGAISIYLHPNVALYGESGESGEPSDPLSDASSEGTRVDIIDSGDGFPEDSLDRVFKRFYKADPARQYRSPQATAQADPAAPTSANSMPQSSSQTSAGGGSGLGLAIAHQIITAHGGFIEAKNHPERGGWMSIWLPDRVLPALK
jgi:two-component system, OmpR family, phosphate regulon sensor histidine kinase PhoR